MIKSNNNLKYLPLVLASQIACTSQDIGSDTGKKDEKPNVIILFADDMGYGDLGCFGHPTIPTPNLDQMAREGVKLTQFYVASPVCSPSRAALLTGRYPVRTGMYGSRKHVIFCESKGGIPTSEVTIAEALKEAGYTTACIGKWHVGHEREYLPLAQGFDYFYGIPYSNDMSPANNTWEGVQHCPPLPLMKNNTIIEGEPNQDSLTIKYTREALNFISQQGNDPFFLYLPYTFPHTPLHVSERFENTSLRGLYGDVVSELDWSVGEILDYLETQNLDENTFVFFTSDNGPWLMREQHGGSAGLLTEGKGTTWEGGVRVPAIAWWPGKIPAGKISASILNSMDLYTTTLTLAGAKVPDDRIVDGSDIMPVLTGESENLNGVFFYYSSDDLFAVRKGPWKMHLTTITRPFRGKIIEKHNPPLLFNINEDPSEQYNLAERYPGVIKEIQATIKEHEKYLEIAPAEFDK